MVIVVVVAVAVIVILVLVLALTPVIDTIAVLVVARGNAAEWGRAEAGWVANRFLIVPRRR